jgi:hypothetical protein
MRGNGKASRTTADKPSMADPEVESNKILDVQSGQDEPKPFFKSSRLSGALSEEGREIESHLGIH